MVPRDRACYAGRQDVTRPTTVRRGKAKAKAKRQAKARPVLSRDRDTNKPDTDNPESDLLRRLALIAENENSSATARVSALRTALEVSGALGRHARKPVDLEATLSPGLLSRSGLEKELERLRRIVLPGTER